MPSVPTPPVEHQMCVLGLLGITSMEKRLELWTDDASEAWTKGFLNKNWIKKGQKLVAFSLSASRKWKTKNWPLPAMVELAEMLAREKGIRVVLLGTDDDAEDASRFMRKTDAKPVNATGKTNIPQLVSLIKRCDGLLTGDSAPMHIAAATGTPFVALFGPTDPDRHLPPAEKRVVLRKQMKCAPCYKPTCMRQIKCMKGIKPGEVFNALMEIME